MRRSWPAALLAAGAVCACEPHSEPMPSQPRTSASADASAPLPERPLRLGHPASLSVKQSPAETGPLARLLGRAIRHHVDVVVPGSSDRVAELLARGELDLALLAPFAYVRAKQRLPGLQLLASLIGEGTPSYRGYIVVAAGGPVHTLADLEGKHFLFADRVSAGGYLFPLALLLDAGLDPGGELGAVSVADSGADVAEAVLEGRADAGALSSTAFARLRTQAISSRLAIVARTDWIPFDAFVAHPGVPRWAVAKLQQELLGLNMRTAEGRAVLGGISTNSGFVVGDDGRYDSVRRVAARIAKWEQARSADAGAPTR